MVSSRKASEPIAIIGTGCRFPGGCNSPSKLWELLREPVDLLKEIPESRFNVDAFYHPNNLHHGTSNVRHSYFLDEDLRQFDAQFFGIKAVEAASIDPQQRLLLETVYESLESAGLSVKRMQGSDTAVYVGVMSADFTDMIGRDTETFPTYFATGTARSILSNRLSYFFNWHGPSMTIDTACSSTLVALHQAVQVLRDGQSKMAVVAGSNLILGPEQYIAESKLQMLSPTGRSRMWDASADGYARGEGVASIVLKPLSQAIADGDHVECVIRETGLNQDGKTKGITMPSATAQAELIRTTYARAGLDLSKRSDRPHYFEAHGTGTPAGDPIEAEAISNAFFGSELESRHSPPNDTLYVGSIKTVVGHTEGTAGLAAIIKASLALQSGTIPPNRLFDRLNPAIEPYYGNLEILTKARDWPLLVKGGVRRVSVNSFGFGGANAHAILESFQPAAKRVDRFQPGNALPPFAFSAVSESSLAANLRAYRDYLQFNSTINLRDLSHTLTNRRTNHQIRLAVAAADADDLVVRLDDAAANIQNQATKANSSVKSDHARARILGVFTGQGAQWARMGAELLLGIPEVQKIVDRLEKSLQSLPQADRPEWSIRNQLLADAKTSEVGTASISQPLCTVVQIILVDLLRHAGVDFAAVVGHSSGEIGAAYAAGVLTAEDAIRVAYYRGLHLKSISRRGSMMAVGTSYDDAEEVCNLPDFEHRLSVAASNSAASVTISGDADAIEEIKAVFDDEKKFTRVLKVDRAYHSHHMEECVEAYKKSLRQCNIRAQKVDPARCRWVSSVFVQDASEVSESLSDQYWASNLLSPVRFHEALEVSLSEDADLTLALEVGPHPALKGPASQTIQESLGRALPYSGLLSRGKNDILSFVEALGFMWCQDDSIVDMTAFSHFTSGIKSSPMLLKDLPSYQWDHGRTFWHESRNSKAFRTRKDLPNELLGRQVLDGAPDQLRWRNVLRPREVDWIQGHQVQGQMVFPCAGYVSAAIEAAIQFSGKQSVQAIELSDFIVGQAIAFDDEDTSVDIMITLTDIKSHKNGLTAQFTFYSAPSNDTLDMVNNASCYLHVSIGDSKEDLLPQKAEDNLGMLEVEPDRFYNALGQLGFGYTGPFRALTSMKRKLGTATGYIENAVSERQVTTLLIHPATLDTAIQSIMLAYCYPGDSMLRSIYLPTGIGKLTVNPMHCLSFAGKKGAVQFDSTATIEGTRGLQGDASIYDANGGHAVQLEGLQTKPLANLTEANDLNIFTELVWDVDRPNREEVIRQSTALELNADLLFSLERVAFFYLRTLNDIVPVKERDNMEWHHKRLFAYVDHVLDKFRRDVNPWARQEWKNDSKEEILAILKKYPENIDLRLMSAVGENLPAVIRGEITMLEPMIENNMLNDFYVIAHGMPRYTEYLARMAGQIGHRYPHMNVLEIGAGTGGATKSFLRHLGEAFSTYTFTDISGGFFPKARETFAAYSSKMTFKVLDIEKDILDQDFEEGSFDLIIASLVLHATRNMEETMHNVRRLLKPGGYLLLLEITENEQMRFGLIFGGLEGWWLGYDDGRAFSPCIGLEEWSDLLERTGFSGIDHSIPHDDALPVPLSIIVSQATNDQVDYVKKPLASTQFGPFISQLTVVCGGMSRSQKLAAEITRKVQPFCKTINQIDSLHKINTDELPVGGTVLCLSDLDVPVFKSIDENKLRGFQEVFKRSKNVLWVTNGARSGDPYSRMVVGFGRTIVLEMLHLCLQFLDIPENAHPDSTSIVETLLRLEITEQWKQDGELDMLYSTEPELFLQDQNYFVPRFKLNKGQNDRYNSNRRAVTNDTSIHDTVIEVVHRQDCHTILESSVLESDAQKGARTVEIDVMYSITKAVEISEGRYLFPVLGKHTRTGEIVLALSPKQGSKVRVPTLFVIPMMMAGNEKDVLQNFFYSLLAHAWLRDVPSGRKVLVLEPSAGMASAFNCVAKSRAIEVVYVTSDTKAAQPEWQYIHSSAPKSAMKSITTSGATCVVNMNAHVSFARRITDAIVARPATKTQASVTSFTGEFGPLDLSDIHSVLMDLMHASLVQQEAIQPGDLDSTTLRDLVSQESGSDTLAVIDWSSSTSVPVEAEPIATKVHFRSDRTYWLVGLTGGLGLSLCEWMVKQGARNVVLTSRNPKVDEQWLEKMKGIGANIKVAANDITNRESVRAIYREICREMPPIAGIAQGAMVLHDTMFIELNMERLNKVIKPKVNGSIYLEELFGDVDLDFFVFFSSMASVTGNPGQSAYAAANMFMSSLATQRRKRGLNGSAVHIGAIFGNGYVTRELTLQQQEFLRKVGNLWLSETDFHQLFAEAVFAGRRDRDKALELSTGLKMIDSDESEAITWFNNPMFQHCIREDQDAQSAGMSSASQVPVKGQLLEASTPAEVFLILRGAFESKLRASLQVQEDRAIIDLAADDLGIDSLVAVDIRSWFIKELQVEMPVLKILSRSTMGELLIQAQELLPATMVPKLGTDKVLNPTDVEQLKAVKLEKKTAAPQPKENQKPKPKPKPKQSNAEQTKKREKAPISKELLKVDQKSEPAPKREPLSRNVTAIKDASITNPESMFPSATTTFKSNKPWLNDSPAISPRASVSPMEPDLKTKTEEENNAQESTSSSSSWSEISDSEKQDEASISSTSSSVDIKAEAEAVADIQVKKKLKLGFAQSRFWFLRQYITDPVTFNIAVSIQLKGSLNIRAFERAVKLIGQRHEALRTRFSTNHSTQEVTQEILTVSRLHLEQCEVSNNKEVSELFKQVKSHSFDLEQGETMRILLVKEPSKTFQLIIAYHHINMDGVSLEVILKDLQMAYDGKFLNPRITQFPDFTEKQRNDYEAGAWEAELDFWRQELVDIPPPLPLLPMSKTTTRQPLTSYAANYAEFNVNSFLQHDIQATCEKLKATPFHFHLTTFYILLARLVDAQQICLGVSSANRSRQDLMESVGLYLNLLPLMMQSDLTQTFTNALKTIRSKSLAAFSHSTVPFDVIVNELDVPRSAAHSPLFQVLVNYRAGVSERRNFCGCESTVAEMQSGQAPYDLSLDVIDNPDGECHVILAGQSVLYDGQGVNMLRDMYLNLLAAFARNPGLRLNNASLYAAEDIDTAVRLGRGPNYSYSWPETIPDRIDDMVEKYPNKIALKNTSGTTLTYRNLADRVDSIAVTLKKASIGDGSRVAVFQEPGSDWICSLLAILRLNAAYIALDARVGLERLAMLTEDSQPDAILVDSASQDDLTGLRTNATPINVSRISSKRRADTVPNAAKAKSIAVIAYTSGSTGSPKGIVMNHHTFRNNVESSTEKWHFREGKETLLHQSSYSFDMSLSQIFLTLSNAGTLHIVPKQLRGDAASLAAMIAGEGITVTEATPSEYISWFRYGNMEKLRNSKWRVAISGGEMVSEHLTSAFTELEKPEVRLIDSYGPTEITFCCASREIVYDKPTVDQGFVVWPNYSVVIVEPDTMKAVPVGMPGEIMIGGAGVVAGYLHSESNVKSFVNDCFASAKFTQNGWTTLHRTGDLGFINADGSLKLNGRISGDTQIKLRGMRMDLREIENALVATAEVQIRDAAVVLRTSEVTGSEFLVAFVTTSDDYDHNALQEIAQRLPLPQYMRPAVVVRLEELPINTSDKIDRRALRSLPLPQDEHSGSVEVELSGAQRQLQEIWREVISPDVFSQFQIGPQSDFFHVGGNSMLLLRLQAAIKTKFNAEVALFNLFEASTLDAMANLFSSDFSDEKPALSEPEVTSQPISVDWETETTVPQLQRHAPSAKTFFTHPECVILTGATGFLGRALLDRLLKDENVQKIHCIAIRKDIDQLPDMFKSPKVVVHKGDLTLPRLGLSVEASAEIFSEAHAVIHNGADVSFMKSYGSLRPANLEGTKELVRMSVPYRLSFHYVSTASVTHLSGQAEYDEMSVSAFHPDFRTGYIATKWASERYLEKVSDDYQLPIWIHRPSSITGAGAPDTDLMSSLLRYSREIRAVPNTAMWKGWLDFVDVDNVAMQIADEVYEDCPWPGGVKYLFESGDREIPMGDLRGVLEREKNRQFQKLSMEDWTVKAQEQGLHVMLGEYLRGFSQVPMVFPRLLKQGGLSVM